MTPPGGSGRRAGGEPAGDAAGHDDEAPGDGDGDLAAMRSVWLSMRDEEPSGRGMAELLAAARGKAAAMAPKPSRWQRWAGALRRPPALALATVLVLLGGAVLLTRRVHKDGGPLAPAVAPAAPVASAPRGAASAGSSSSTPTGDGDATGRAAADDRAATASPSPGAGNAKAANAAAAPAGRAPGSAAGDGGPGLRGPARDGAGRSAVPEPPAVHRAPSREAPPAADTSLVSELGSASVGRRSPLVQQCEAAARRGDCAAVRRLIAQISQTDPGYRARVAQDAAFARCLE